MRRSMIHRDEGFSLAEILVTIAIVGVTFATILGGLMTSIRVSGLQQEEATADAVARSAAEWLKDGVQTPYMNCAGTGTYSLAALSVPSGYSVAITSVQYWDGVAPAATGTYTLSSPSSSHIQPTCPNTGDKGLQRITIEATSPDGQAAEWVQIMKRNIS